MGFGSECLTTTMKLIYTSFQLNYTERHSFAGAMLAASGQLEQMYAIRRLKPDRSFGMILLPFGALAAGALVGVIFGLESMLMFFAAFFWLYAAYSFLTFARTGKPGFVVVSLYQVSIGLVAFSLPERLRGSSQITWFFMAITLFFAVWMLFLALTKRIKWRGREILELAAAPVEQLGDGFTARPLPVGRTEFTQPQILGFAEFVRKNLIAVPYLGKDKVVFVPVAEGREPAFILGLAADYAAETWVAFDFAGNVSANVSHRDDLEYQEALSFDKLCESLGNLFVEFMALFQRGEGVRIIDRMDALRMPFFW